MVIKTELCAYTEGRIYPGRGMRYVARDGKVHIFGSAKARRLHNQRIKPVKLRWTQAWRRHNKKGKVEESAKKRARRTFKVQKAIVGLSLEDFQRKKARRPELRAAAKEAATKEAKVKAEKKAAQAAKAKAAMKSTGPAQKQQFSKQAKPAGKGGGKR